MNKRSDEGNNAPQAPTSCLQPRFAGGGEKVAAAAAASALRGNHFSASLKRGGGLWSSSTLPCSPSPRRPTNQPVGVLVAGEPVYNRSGASFRPAGARKGGPDGRRANRDVPPTQVTPRATSCHVHRLHSFPAHGPQPLHLH